MALRTYNYFLPVWVALMLCVATGRAQPLPVVNCGGLAGKQWIFLAEVHSLQENPDFYQALIPCLAGETGLAALVLEMGNSAAYLLDQYVQEGDTTYFRYYREPRRRILMDTLRAINSRRPTSNRLHVRGMDFERMHFIVAVKHILERHGATDAALYRYLAALPDTMALKTDMSTAQHKLRKQVYGEARRLYKKDEDLLRAATGTDYAMLDLMMNNAAREEHFAMRDKGMYRNLERQRITDRPFLCIAGGYHLQYHRKQVFPSLMKRLLRDNPRAAGKVGVIEEVFSGTSVRYRLFREEGAGPDTLKEVTGPEYLTGNDSAMRLAYRNYASKRDYRLVNRDVFWPLVTGSNHGLDTWFIFFGDGTVRRKR